VALLCFLVLEENHIQPFDVAEMGFVVCGQLAFAPLLRQSGSKATTIVAQHNSAVAVRWVMP
jgi:hypothetical protein